MAALFPKIYDFIEANPHKDAILRWREPTATEGLVLSTWEGFAIKPLDPPGALSCLLFHSEPLYELATPALRKQILTEKLLEFHERVDKELIGRRYPRKKIQDLFAGELAVQTPQSSTLLEDCLCELSQIQKIRLNRQTKRISVSPPDLRTWASGKPLLVSEEDNRWIFQSQGAQDLATWLLAKEDQGWTVAWPTADGKLDDLKLLSTQLGLAAQAKEKKDDLAVRVGKAQSLQTLRSIQFRPIE